MSKRKQIYFLLSTVFLVSLIWGMLILIKTLLKENDNNNLNYLPENTSYALRIDGRKLAQKTLFSVFIESKDEKVLKMIRSFFQQSAFKENEFRNAGIDYLSDILIFSIPLENRPIAGILFNVSNPGLFKKGFLNSTNVHACEDHVGIVLFDHATNPLGKKRLNIYASRILHKKYDVRKLPPTASKTSETLIEWFGNAPFFGQNMSNGPTDVQLGIAHHTLFIYGKTGDRAKTLPDLNTLSKTLKPDGLHCSTSLVPEKLYDTLNHWLKPLQSKLPPLRSISLNYRGTKIVNHSSGYFIIPQMDLLIETKSPFDLAAFLDNKMFTSFPTYRKDSISIQFQGEKFFFRQLSATSFYLGKSANPEFKKSIKRTLVRVQGDLKAMLQIQGQPLLSSILDMIPEYRASKELSQNISHFEFSLRKSSENHFVLRGKLIFTPHCYPMNEIIKFLLTGEFLS